MYIQMIKPLQKGIATAFVVMLCVVGLNSATMAAPPPGTTTAPYTVSYSARLTDTGGTPITTAQTVRFSLWTDADFDAGDLLGTGAIDPGAGGYAGWFEEHSLTPDANGLFHVDLGTITTLPNVTSATHVYLQVDVKPDASPLTAYEVIDPTGSTADATDRHILNSAFYALNADTVDNADVGTDPGDLVVLNGSGLFEVDYIPGGTNADSFVIDADDSVAAGTIPLIFGTTLAEVLEYDIGNSYFNFSDDVNITGDLTVTGNANFAGSSEFHMREVADEAAADCTTVNELVLDTTENRIYVCTATGSPGTWAATGGAGGTYSQSIILEPEYEDGVIVADGSDNKGKIESFYADTDGDPGNDNFNYYRWTTRQTAMQDIDLTLRVDLPDGFTGFQATPVELTYRTSDGVVATNHIDVEIEDTDGAAVTLAGGTDLTSAAAFTTSGITFGGAPTFTAGEQITIKIKPQTTSSGYTDVGRIIINYVGS